MATWSVLSLLISYCGSSGLQWRVWPFHWKSCSWTLMIVPLTWPASEFQVTWSPILNLWGMAASFSGVQPTSLWSRWAFDEPPENALSFASKGDSSRECKQQQGETVPDLFGRGPVQRPLSPGRLQRLCCENHRFETRLWAGRGSPTVDGPDIQGRLASPIALYAQGGSSHSHAQHPAGLAADRVRGLGQGGLTELDNDDGTLPAGDRPQDPDLCDPLPASGLL